MAGTRQLRELLAPNGAAATPAYAFANDVDTGMYLSAVGDARLVVGAQTRLTATDDGTNGSTILNARGTGAVKVQFGGADKVTIDNTTITIAAGTAIRGTSGTAATPEYSFASSVDMGMYRNAAGDLRLIAAGAGGGIPAQISIVDDTTDGSISLFAKGAGSVKALVGVFAKLTVDNSMAAFTIPVRFAEQAAPATPAASTVYLYAKADGLLYSKDDAGVETLVSGGAGSLSYPLLAPDGTISAPSYSFASDTDAGMFMSAVGTLRIAVGGGLRILMSDDGTNGSTTLEARGTGSVHLSHTSSNKLSVGSTAITTTLPIRAPDGDATTPSYSWSGGTGAGFARVGNRTTVIHGSAAVADFGADGIRTADGSLTNPAHSFLNDIDTGWFLQAAGDMRGAVGGVLKFQATDDGTNGNALVGARGTGSVKLTHGGTNKLIVDTDDVELTVPLTLTEAAAPSTPASGKSTLYAKTDGLLYAKDDGGEESVVSGIITRWKTADQAVSATTFANDTHLTFPVAIGRYLIEGILFVFSAATTTGPKIAVNGPTLATNGLRFAAHGQITQGAAGAASTYFGNAVNAYDAATTLGASVLGTAATTPTPIWVTGYLNVSAAGTFVLRIASEVAAASITYMEGSWMRLTRVA